MSLLNILMTDYLLIIPSRDEVQQRVQIKTTKIEESVEYEHKI